MALSFVPSMVNPVGLEDLEEMAVGHEGGAAPARVGGCSWCDLQGERGRCLGDPVRFLLCLAIYFMVVVILSAVRRERGPSSVFDSEARHVNDPQSSGDS